MSKLSFVLVIPMKLSLLSGRMQIFANRDEIWLQL
jgi:hypothetical protein